MLKVEQGVFGYDKSVRILNGISFKVEAGKILTVLGPNGAGKTTLLRCMVGLLAWQNGRTLFADVPLARIPAREFWKKVSYVPQAKSFTVPYTVLEMVVMGRTPYIGTFAVPTAEDYRIARETLTELGITQLEKKHCTRISGGELQLVLIARALVSGPQLIILDEPESHLDFRNQLVVLERLKGIAAQRGIACVINTHYPENAFRIADYALLLGRGGRYCYGPTREIITEVNLQEFFGVRVKMVTVPDGERTYSTIYPLELAEQFYAV
jgi:iron complex transport system ATP-binding protein